jgi:hypothetical protein
LVVVLATEKEEENMNLDNICRKTFVILSSFSCFSHSYINSKTRQEGIKKTKILKKWFDDEKKTLPQSK